MVFVYLILGLVTCNKSISVINGFFNKLGFFNGAGNTLFLTCNIPYTVIGSPNYVCNDTGQWEGNGTCGM